MSKTAAKLQVRIDRDLNEAEERILAAWEESKDPANRSKPYTDVEEMFRDIRREMAVEQ